MSSPAAPTESTVAVARSCSAAGRIGGGAGMAALATLALLWGYGVFRLGTLWYSNPDYTFGWFVPLLVGCLAWERWKRRPAPVPPEGTTGPFLVAAVLVLVMLAASLFLEVVPNWRLAGWTFALAMLGITFAVVYLVGGRSWVNHFMFPALFFLVAVPWPGRIEVPLIDLLSQGNAVISTAVSNSIGVPAIRRGVLIQTGGGLAGIDDACSGIRSFQSSVMIALFLGELLSYGLFRRFFFIVSATVLAFGCNIIRTVYLVHVCDSKGKEAIEASHDPAGFTILGVTLLALLALAWIFRTKSREQPRAPMRAWEHTDPGASTPLSQRTSVVLVTTVILSGIASLHIVMQLWFGPGEKAAFERSQAGFQFLPPSDMPGFQKRQVSPKIAQALRFSEGDLLEWSDSAGRAWKCYNLRWSTPRNGYEAMVSTLQARAHAPEYCLVKAGMLMQQNSGKHPHEYSGVVFLRRFSRFLDGGRTVHVLSLYWDGVVAGQRTTADIRPSTASGFSQALEACKYRDRGRGEKRVIEIAIWGASSDQEAENAFKELLNRAISP